MSADVAMTPPVSHDGPSSKRKRSRSRSPRNSPPPTRRRRSASPPRDSRGSDAPRVSDIDPVRRRERERQLALRMAETTLEGKDAVKRDAEFDAKAEFQKLVSSKSGGVYMPPARLRALQAAAAEDKASTEYQRLSWDALRKSLTGIVNRVNITNIKNVIPELFAENIIRGRGLFAQSVMKAQSSSLPYTPIFAALVAIVNSQLPQVGELILTRLIIQFRRSLKRNDKTVCVATSMFIAHLVNQRVADEVLPLQILIHLLENPTDDSVEVAVGFAREVGAFLDENAKSSAEEVYNSFRNILRQEGKISHRVQYMVEVFFQIRKEKFKDHPILSEGLDLVQDEDQITHPLALDEEGLDRQDTLNIFKFDPNFLENEAKYKEMKAEILGDDDAEDSGDSDDGDEDEDDDEAGGEVAGIEGIQDRTETNLVNLRRVIYLTIMNSLTYEEAVHKLMKVNIQEGQEIELCNMIVECCSQERSYSQFYGLIGERFCKLNRVWFENFEEAFATYYDTIHRYETNRLRNIARFFGHLLASDSMSWAVLSVIKMNEDDTTSSSRIFVKILFQEMSEDMGLAKLAARFKDPSLAEHFTQLFPMDNPKNTRFSINYFTSIGLGVVTEAMREHLKNAPQLIMAQRRAALEAESSDSDSSDSDSDSDSYSSDSSYDSRDRDRGRGRGRSHSRSYSRSRSRGGRRHSRSRSRSIVGTIARGFRRSVSPRRGGLVGAIMGRSRSRSIARRLSRGPRSVSRSYSRSRSRSPSRYHRRSRSRSRGGYRDDYDYDDDYNYDYDHGHGHRGHYPHRRRSRSREYYGRHRSYSPSVSPPPPVRYIAPPPVSAHLGIPPPLPPSGYSGGMPLAPPSVHVPSVAGSVHSHHSHHSHRSMGSGYRESPVYARQW
ncbi:MIF4G-domain-containing protein [Clavulina sp. PMI_390]|nr:MIF4G-domain-containing protein [Clavulina sp. PMI_390]